MASMVTPASTWVLVYDWKKKVISRTRLISLRENAYQVFPIPKPSYLLDIYGLRLDLSSYTDFDKLYVTNVPPAFSDSVDPSFDPSSYLLPERLYSTTSSAWLEDSVSNIGTPYVSTIPGYYLETPHPATSSAWPDDSAFYTSLPFGLETSDAKSLSTIPRHDVHNPNKQSTSALSRSTFSPVLRAISKDLEQAYPSSTGWYEANFTVQWELDQYLETELDFDPKAIAAQNILEPVLTVTATANAAYATTARSYIQREWPDDRADLLHHLGQWACGTDSGSFGLPGGVTTTRLRSTESKNGPSPARVNVKGNRELIISVAQQLAWLTAVFRKPSDGQASYSLVVFKRIPSQPSQDPYLFEIVPQALLRVPRSSNTCWLDLFTNCVIAWGFPIPERRNGEEGIELPFQLMTSQAGIMFSKTYKGGLFLRGLSTLIYPTASWANHQSVQWHIVDSGNSRTRLPPGTVPLLDSTDEVRKSNWMRWTDYERLASARRTFLGYCKEVNIHLAVVDSEISQVTCSRAENESHRPTLLLDSLTGGTSGMGMVSAQTSMRFVRPKGLVKCSRHDKLPGLLDSAQDRPVLLYDDHPKAQKAWLVPTLSVVLHMAHLWARGKNLLNNIPYVSPCWNTEEMALRLIQESGELRLRKECRDEYECLGDIVQKLLISLEELIVDEALVERDPEPTITFESSKVYGWDLVDVARLSLTCRRKQLSIQGSWAILSNESNEVLTLFCQGLGEVIRPAPTSNICSAWNPIPAARDYLTATVPCLQQLSLQYGRASTGQCLRLTKDGYWHWPGNGIFEDCDNANLESTSNKHNCVKVPQRISKTDVKTKNDQHLPTQGAVIFGTSQLLRIAPANLHRRLLANHDTNSTDSSIRHEHPSGPYETSNKNTSRLSFRALKSSLLRKTPVFNEFFS